MSTRLSILASKALNQAQKNFISLRAPDADFTLVVCNAQKLVITSESAFPPAQLCIVLYTSPSHRRPLQQPGMLIWRLLLEHLVHPNRLMPTHQPPIRCWLAPLGLFANFNVFFFGKMSSLSTHSVTKQWKCAMCSTARETSIRDCFTSDALISARGPP